MLVVESSCTVLCYVMYIISITFLCEHLGRFFSKGDLANVLTR